MLIRVDDQYKFIPITSKVKLNKKRLAVVEKINEDGEFE